MMRRILVASMLCFCCLPVLGQSMPTDVERRIEHQLRSAYTIPPDVLVTVGSLQPSTEVPGYDVFAVEVDTEDKQRSFSFLLSKDRSTMMRLNKFDLTKDAFGEVMR